MYKYLFCMLLCFCGFAGAGCNPSITFQVNIKGSGTLEAGGLLDQLLEGFGVGELNNVDFSTTQEFKNNDVRKEHVTQASLRSLRFVIESPSGQNFDFMEKVEFFVEAPGLEKKLVASKTVPKGVTTFDFDVVALDLSPYIRAEKVSFSTKVTGRKPSKETKIEVQASFSITASLFRAGSNGG